jgi:photosystem II stability/assembly factor-like uncharacterized protein
VSRLAFVDRENGFAYGPGLYSTHDGGQSWQRIDLGGRVTSVGSGAGQVFAIVESSTYRASLFRSVVSGNRWSEVAAPTDLGGDLEVSGRNLFSQTVQHGDIGSHLAVSLDAGQSWLRYDVPVPGLGCTFDQVSAPVLWEHCSTGMLSANWRSADNGRTFKENGGEGVGVSTNGAAFVAAANDTVFIGFQQMLRSTDGGFHYAVVGPRSGYTWSSLSFVDPNHGLAILRRGEDGSGARSLWATADGGAEWHQISLGTVGVQDVG